MANQTFYFGTAERMSWVPAPNTGMAANNISWRTTGTLLNGGSYERSSLGSHLEYDMSWPVMSHVDAYSLLDYFNGVYGNGPYYFLDPMAMAWNILPVWMAAPRMQVDGPSMLVNSSPSLGGPGTASNGYPGYTAIYGLAAGQVGKMFVFPVPPGYVFRFGWHGSAFSTARVRVVGATTVDTNAISLNGSTTKYSTSVAPGADGFVGIQLIGGASGGSLTLRGMNAILTPTTGSTVRTNLILNPRLGTGVTGWIQQLGTTEAATLTRITGAVDGPLADISTYYRKAVTTAKTAGSSGLLERDAGTITGGVAGETLTGSIYVRPSVTLDIRCSMTPRFGGASSGAATSSAIVSCPANVWTRLSVTGVTTAVWDSVQIWANEVGTVPVGGTVDATAALLERAPSLGSYFDGSTPDAGTYDYEWTGSVNASTSIQRSGAENMTGDFVSGRGNSGVQLRDNPQVTAYSAYIPNANVGVSATFIETGGWL